MSAASVTSLADAHNERPSTRSPIPALRVKAGDTWCALLKYLLLIHTLHLLLSWLGRLKSNSQKKLWTLKTCAQGLICGIENEDVQNARITSKRAFEPLYASNYPLTVNIHRNAK
jgi:hypothetical protein